MYITARPSGKLARWALAKQEMNLVVKHRSGKSNSNADVLSRVPIATVCAIGTSTTFAEEYSDKIALKFECI